MKRCPNCGHTKPLSDFHVDKSKASGHMSWCKSCTSVKDKQKYLTRLEKEGRTPRPIGRPHNNRHGGAIEWARMFEEQDGLCYLCLRPLPEDRSKIHVDHDHTCCNPGYKGRWTDSCQHCRRGLTHERCNQIWGLAAEDPELLRTLASQGERAAAEARVRIGGKPQQDDLLAWLTQSTAGLAAGHDESQSMLL